MFFTLMLLYRHDFNGHLSCSARIQSWKSCLKQLAFFLLLFVSWMHFCMYLSSAAVSAVLCLVNHISIVLFSRSVDILPKRSGLAKTTSGESLEGVIGSFPVFECPPRVSLVGDVSVVGVVA